MNKFLTLTGAGPAGHPKLMSGSQSKILKELASKVQGAVYLEEEVLESLGSDFGSILRQAPKAVVVPASSADVVLSMKTAQAGGYSVGIRGAGQSQGGQSLSEGGILLDMSALSGLGPLQGESAWVDAGLQWKKLVSGMGESGRVPAVFPELPDSSLAGVVSSGGLGVSSHRHGLACQQVEEMEVVTCDGYLVRCSESENQDLFDAVRAGMGQFGVVTKLRLRLLPAPGSLHTFNFLYDDTAALLTDLFRWGREEEVEYLEVVSSPVETRYEHLGQWSAPFGCWFHLARVTRRKVMGSRPLAAPLCYRKLHEEEAGFSDFFLRHEPRLELWRRAAGKQKIRPWVELLLPGERAAEFVEGILKALPIHLLGEGIVKLTLLANGTMQCPLFPCPPGETSVRFSLLPVVPRSFLAELAPLLDKAAELCRKVGGKILLTGFTPFESFDWAQHFGEHWREIERRKRFFDPCRILNPGWNLG